MSAIAATIVGAAALGTSIWASWKARKQAERDREYQRRYAEQQAELAYQRSLPITQMSNLSDAKLNPYLAYQRVEPANYEPQKMESIAPVDYSRAFGDAMKGYLSVQQASMNKQQIEALHQQTRRMTLENDILEATKGDKIQSASLANAQKWADITAKEATAELAKARKYLTDKQLAKVKAEIEKLLVQAATEAKRGGVYDQQILSLQLENGLNEILKPLGLHRNDSAVIRALVVASKNGTLLNGLGSSWNAAADVSKEINDWIDEWMTRRRLDKQPSVRRPIYPGEITPYEWDYNKYPIIVK